MDFLERIFRIILLLTVFYCYAFFLGIEKLGKSYLPDPRGIFFIVTFFIALFAMLFIPDFKYRKNRDNPIIRKVKWYLRRLYIYLFVMVFGMVFLFTSHGTWDVSFLFGHLFLLGGFCGVIFTEERRYFF